MSVGGRECGGPAVWPQRTPLRRRVASLQDFIRAADERLDDYLRRLDEGDIEEGGTGGGGVLDRIKPLAKLAAMAMIANLTGIDGMDQTRIFTAHALRAWLGGRSW